MLFDPFWGWKKKFENPPHVMSYIKSCVLTCMYIGDMNLFWCAPNAKFHVLYNNGNFSQFLELFSKFCLRRILNDTCQDTTFEVWHGEGGGGFSTFFFQPQKVDGEQTGNQDIRKTVDFWKNSFKLFISDPNDISFQGYATFFYRKSGQSGTPYWNILWMYSQFMVWNMWCNLLSSVCILTIKVQIFSNIYENWRK